MSTQQRKSSSNYYKDVLRILLNFQKLKKNIRTLIQQIENRNKKGEIIKKNQTNARDEKYYNNNEKLLHGKTVDFRRQRKESPKLKTERYFLIEELEMR